MVRKWKLGATGAALLAATCVVVACSSSGDDDSNNGGSGGTGAKGGTGSGGTSAGKGGTSTGGTGGSTGGTGGSTGGTGGSSGTTGTTGGSAGTGTAGTGTGGMSGGGGAAPYTCAMSPATCNLIHTWTFSTTSQWQGTYTYQPNALMSDKTTDPTVFHITGMVSDYDGFGIYTGKCSSLSGYTGVTFTLKGTTASVDKPNTVKFVIQMNADEPIDTTNSKGACVGSSGVECISPNKVIMTSDSPQTVMFSDLTGGKPIAALDPTQVLGLQWQIDPDGTKTPFAVDLQLSEVTLIGTPTGDCSMGGGGMGAGGMAGTGAGGASTAGQAGASTAGQGGVSTAGQGGANGGTGTGGMSGRGAGGMGGRSAGGTSAGGNAGRASGGMAGR
jgi:hypothetical protein